MRFHLSLEAGGFPLGGWYDTQILRPVGCVYFGGHWDKQGWRWIIFTRHLTTHPNILFEDEMKCNARQIDNSNKIWDL